MTTTPQSMSDGPDSAWKQAVVEVSKIPISQLGDLWQEVSTRAEAIRRATAEQGQVELAEKIMGTDHDLLCALDDDALVDLPTYDHLRLHLGELTAEEARIAQAAYRLAFVERPTTSEQAPLPSFDRVVHALAKYVPDWLQQAPGGYEDNSLAADEVAIVSGSARNVFRLNPDETVTLLRTESAHTQAGPAQVEAGCNHTRWKQEKDGSVTCANCNDEVLPKGTRWDTQAGPVGYATS